ncbi:hypothetical protein D5F11_023810 [Siminovitchia terrae]|uniref:WGxxGxxG-CTERM domain-containing protein n=1 Tax=Siminovitchia terrae TaxID=1914933 RepID=A0A429X133_SIMTE|nr:WGxxGxxG family protein [Siminovitchia terrae]RST57199.1 hypothetical protein D5F11_023810 [Siminovitchia terrae]
MFKKILYSSFALLFSSVLFGMSIGHAQDPTIDNQEASSDVTHIAQNDDNVNNVNNNGDNDMDWGWIGLVGLAGLFGLRRNDRK